MPCWHLPANTVYHNKTDTYSCKNFYEEIPFNFMKISSLSLPMIHLTTQVVTICLSLGVTLEKWLGEMRSRLGHKRTTLAAGWPR